MKRLFGLIGLTYLSVLAVVFYCYSIQLVIILLAAAVLATAAGILLRIFKRQREIGNNIIMISLSAFAAVAIIFLYMNYFVSPIVEGYSDQKITIEGYVCDEIQIRDAYAYYPIKTDKINGEDQQLNLYLSVRNDYPISEFDKVKATFNAAATDSRYYLSKRVFITGYEDSDFRLERTGETKFILYKYAVEARKAIKKSLNQLLSSDGAGLCKAILLGDKTGLSPETEHDFNRTGTTFLIVVSGLHLSVAVMAISFILKRVTIRKRVICSGAIIAVLLFTALSGFAPSVSRAAITLCIAYIGVMINRNSDGINSLGIAALVLTVPNPYAVADLGMILSFTATLGIILWANRIKEWIDDALRLNKIRFRRIRAVIQFFTNLISVSLSAALWVVPISILAFKHITPLVVIVATITEPIASAVLVLALLLSILSYIPFFNITVFCLSGITDFLCMVIIKINAFFSSLQFCYINADKPYFLIWLGVTALSVVVGYIIHARKSYIFLSVMLSVFTLLLGFVITELTLDDNTTLKIYQNKSGMTVYVQKENNLSLLCCGGSSYYEYKIYDDLIELSSEIDNFIIPNSNDYTAYLSDYSRQFDIERIFYNEKDEEKLNLPRKSDCKDIENNETVKLKLNSDTTDYIVNAGNVMYQYISSKNFTLLFVPKGADIKNLPEEYRKADYILLDGVSKNSELLSCDKLIYTGKINDRFEKYKIVLEQDTQELVLLSQDSMEIK